MKTTKKRIALGAVGAIVAVGMFGACSDSTTPDVQSAPAASTAAAPAGDAPTKSAPSASAPAGDVPAEYESALAKARSYAENMHMSKAAVRDQLVSEYGESFPKAAADYAMASRTGREARQFAVDRLIDLFTHHRDPWGRDRVRSELAGRDLTCWCPEDQPCHADVLLEIANGDES